MVCVSTFVSFCVHRFGQINHHQFATMSRKPPSNAPPLAASPTSPHQTAVTYNPPTGPQQQQQPQQLVVAQTPVTVAQTQRAQTFVAHIILSCVVMWCCAPPCGLIAFIMACK